MIRDLVNFHLGLTINGPSNTIDADVLMGQIEAFSMVYNASFSHLSRDYELHIKNKKIQGTLTLNYLAGRSRVLPKNLILENCITNGILLGHGVNLKLIGDKNEVCGTLEILSETGVQIKNSSVEKIVLNNSRILDISIENSNVELLQLGPDGSSNSSIVYEIDGFDLKNANFNKFLDVPSGCRKISINNSVWEDVSIDEIGKGRGPTINADVYFENCEFKDVRNARQHYYRDLKKQMIEQKNEIMASQFAALELYCKHKGMTKKTPFTEKTLSWLYLALNSFGLDPYRPILYILFITILSTGICVLAEAPDEIIGYSAVLSLFGPFKLLWPSKIEISGDAKWSLVLFIVGLLSSILWFFQILSIRKRFKIDT